MRKSITAIRQGKQHGKSVPTDLLSAMREKHYKMLDQKLGPAYRPSVAETDFQLTSRVRNFWRDQKYSLLAAVRNSNFFTNQSFLSF